jgi:hypothetical protein
MKINKISNRQKPWRETKNWKFPYEAKNITELLKNKKYIDDRKELFHKHGNGWLMQGSGLNKKRRVK